MKIHFLICVQYADSTDSNFLTADAELPFVPAVGSYLLEDVFGNLEVERVGFGFDGKVHVDLKTIFTRKMEETVSSVEEAGFKLSRANTPEWKKRHPHDTIGEPRETVLMTGVPDDRLNIRGITVTPQAAKRLAEFYKDRGLPGESLQQTLNRRLSSDLASGALDDVSAQLLGDYRFKNPKGS